LKNILILHSSNDLYGASKVLLNIVDCFNEKGYRVDVILPFHGNIDDKLIHKVHNLSHYNLGVFRKKYLNFFGLFNRFYKIIKSTIHIFNYIKKNEIDLVYINTSVIWSGVLASYVSKRKSLVHIHEIPYGSNLYNFISGVFFKYFADSIIVVSKKVRDHWANYVNLKKIKVIYNYSQFFDTDKLNKTNEKKSEFTISNISRIVPQKGIEYLIEISKELSKFDKKFRINIIGDTLKGSESYLDFLKKIVKKNNLQKNVFFRGFKYDIKSVILESDLILQTPIKPDSLPTVIIDSLTLNRPVVSTDTGGCSEILNKGENGLLIPLNDPKSSATIIYEYSKNLKLQKQHLINAKTFLNQNFNLVEFKKRILNEINRVYIG
jgi:glycosyltransferase involved in cell wall biosynthesis